MQRLRCHEAAEMLGIWLAPNGNPSKCVSVLEQKAIDWGLKVRLGDPSPVEAWTAIHTNVSVRIKYLLPACTPSEKECQSIMYPALKAVLPKSGITVNVEGAMRDGPSGPLGGDILSLFHYMGTSRNSCLIEQMEHDTPLGKIL